MKLCINKMQTKWQKKNKDSKVGQRSSFEKEKEGRNSHESRDKSKLGIECRWYGFIKDPTLMASVEFECWGTQTRELMVLRCSTYHLAQALQLTLQKPIWHVGYQFSFSSQCVLFSIFHFIFCLFCVIIAGDGIWNVACYDDTATLIDWKDLK